MKVRNVVIAIVEKSAIIPDVYSQIKHPNPFILYIEKLFRYTNCLEVQYSAS